MTASALAIWPGSSIDCGSAALRSGGGPLESSMVMPAASFVPEPAPT
jgi:hypothetical protein